MVHGNKGRKRPDLTLRNLTDSSSHRPEVKSKISVAMKGKHNSPETEFKLVDNYTKFHNKWRNKVFERDKHICRKCGKINFKKGEKAAHHIIPEKSSVKLKYSKNNGICLCRGCHTAFHRKFLNGKKIGFLQIVEWLKT